MYSLRKLIDFAVGNDWCIYLHISVLSSSHASRCSWCWIDKLNIIEVDKQILRSPISVWLAKSSTVVLQLSFIHMLCHIFHICLVSSFFFIIAINIDYVLNWVEEIVSDFILWANEPASHVCVNVEHTTYLKRMLLKPANCFNRECLLSTQNDSTIRIESEYSRELCYQNLIIHSITAGCTYVNFMLKLDFRVLCEIENQ